MPHLVSPLLPTSPKPSSKSEGLPSIPRAPDEASRDQNLTLRLLPVVPPTRVLIQPQPLCPGEERSLFHCCHEEGRRGQMQGWVKPSFLPF